jgi:hypothetical protein
MKKIQRIGHGFRNLHNYRLRLLLASPFRDTSRCLLASRSPQPPRAKPPLEASIRVGRRRSKKLVSSGALGCST